MSSFKPILVAVCILCAFCGPSNADDVHEAAASGDLETLSNLLQSDETPVDATDDDGNTPLILACENGHLEIARFLVQKGANVDAASYMGQTPLHRASEKGFHEIVNLLIENGAGIDLKNGRGRTPLFMAAWRSGNVDICRVLLGRGADINTRDLNGEYPLLMASYYGHEEVVDLLMEKGVALPTEKDELQRLLYRAAFRDNKKFFDWLISKGAEIRVVNEEGGFLLRAAASGGSRSIAEYLISKGVHPDWANTYGYAPIHLAASEGRRDLIELLVEKGADINLRTIQGKTAFNLAHETGQKEVIDLLESKKADQSPQRFPVLEGDYLGETPPGDQPKMFAVGIVSDMPAEHSTPVFSNDGSEVYWSPSFGSRILHMKRENGRWTPPAPASFSSEHGDDAPFFSRDNSRLYFLSLRPLKNETPSGKENIWYVEKRHESWSEPKPVSDAVNAYPMHWQFAIAPDYSLYFSSTRDGGYGVRDLYKSILKEGEYSEPVNLGPVINTENTEHMPFVASDDSYLLFSSRQRRDGIGGFDIYISFREKDGAWATPKNLGRPVNSEGDEINPIVTPDGKYLFFYRDGDIYWTSASIIERNRPKRAR